MRFYSLEDWKGQQKVNRGGGREILLDKRDDSCYCPPETCFEERKAPHTQNQKYIPGLESLVSGRANLAMNGNHVGGKESEEDARIQSITDVTSQQSS